MESTRSVRDRIASFRRSSLSFLPTPFEKMPRLSERLGIQLYVKRDDQTGLAFGGNKARKLEFILGDALEQRADTIITWAGVQSNWCRQTAAGARRIGMKPILVLFKRAGLPAEYDGNLLLDTLLNADVRMIQLESGRKLMHYSGVRDIIDAIVEEERKAGRHPYIAPIGGSLVEASMTKPFGALGYVECVAELAEQGATPEYIVFATGSAGTQAGLIAGLKLLFPNAKALGIAVSDDRATMTSYVEATANATLEALGVSDRVAPGDVVVFDQYIKEGYGIVNRDVVEAVRLTARVEGLLLDPVYTAKAMVGLQDLVARGYIPPGSNVVFLHSGGTPALFPYRKELLA